MTPNARTLALHALALGMLAAGAASAQLVGGNASLGGSDFCRSYGCAWQGATPQQARPHWTFFYSTNIAGVTVGVTRRPADRDGGWQQAAAGPATGARVEVNVGRVQDREAAARLVADFMRLAGGTDQFPGLYRFCIGKATDANLPRNTEDLIVLQENIAVKCTYREPGTTVLFTAFPPDPEPGDTAP